MKIKEAQLSRIFVCESHSISRVKLHENLNTVDNNVIFRAIRKHVKVDDASYSNCFT